MPTNDALEACYWMLLELAKERSGGEQSPHNLLLGLGVRLSVSKRLRVAAALYPLVSEQCDGVSRSSRMSLLR